MSAVEEAQNKVAAASDRYRDAVHRTQRLRRMHPIGCTVADIRAAEREQEARWSDYRAALTVLRDVEEVESR